MATAVLTACTILTGLSKLDEGPVAPKVEAGTTDMGVADGPSTIDTGIPDRPNVVDAKGAWETGSGPPDAGQGIGSYCASLSPAPTFCEDFDEGTLGPWSYIDTNGGTLGLTHAEAKSPPASLLVTLAAFSVEAGPDAGEFSETVNLKTLGTYTSLRMGFDLYVPAPITSSQNAVGFVGLPAVCPNLLIGPMGGEISGCELPDGGEVPTTYFQSPPVEAWTRVTIDMFVTPSSANPATTNPINVYYNSVQVCCADGVMTTPATFVQPGVDYGLFNQFAHQTYSSTGWALNFDNVTFDEETSAPLQPPL
jgi:hypothetical protein